MKATSQIVITDAQCDGLHHFGQAHWQDRLRAESYPSAAGIGSNPHLADLILPVGRIHEWRSRLLA